MLPLMSLPLDQPPLSRHFSRLFHAAMMLRRRRLIFAADTPPVFRRAASYAMCALRCHTPDYDISGMAIISPPRP